jgi:hypothetical protein
MRSRLSLLRGPQLHSAPVDHVPSNFEVVAKSANLLSSISAFASGFANPCDGKKSKRLRAAKPSETQPFNLISSRRHADFAKAVEEDPRPALNRGLLFHKPA